MCFVGECVGDVVVLVGVGYCMIVIGEGVFVEILV